MSPDIFPLSAVTPKRLTWLWRPRIPAGRLSLLVGHPDRGKSLLACTFASHVSTGLAWPDGQLCPQGKVVFLEAEDALDETVVPRLQAAGAKLDNILTWHARDLSRLAAFLIEEQPKLCVLSPLNTYLPKINTWHDQDVRKVLQPLADLATASTTAILGIMHPPKRQQALPIHAVIGSVAFGAVARSVLAVERGEHGLYLLEGIKQNLAQAVVPLGYRILPSHDNEDVAVVEWVAVPETVSLIPPDSEQSALAEACEFLRMALANGSPIRSTNLKVGAEQNGISWRTISRARQVVGVQSERVFKGDKSYWELFLPPLQKIG